MDAVPASVIWAHVLPHVGASRALHSLARTCRTMWAERPSAADVVEAEVEALRREAPQLHARLGGTGAVVGLARAPSCSGVRLAALVHAVRAAERASRAPGAAYKSALAPLLDGGLVKAGAGAAATFDLLLRVFHAKPGGDRFAPYFAVLVLDYARSRMPFVAVGGDWARAALCCGAHALSTHRVYGSKGRGAARRLAASMRRTIEALAVAVAVARRHAAS